MGPSSPVLSRKAYFGVHSGAATGKSPLTKLDVGRSSRSRLAIIGSKAFSGTTTGNVTRTPHVGRPGQQTHHDARRYAAQAKPPARVVCSLAPPHRGPALFRFSKSEALPHGSSHLVPCSVRRWLVRSTHTRFQYSSGISRCAWRTGKRAE